MVLWFLESKVIGTDVGKCSEEDVITKCFSKGLFCLGTRARDCWLFLCSLRDEVGVEENTETSRRTARIRTMGIGIGLNQERIERTWKEKTHI